MVTAMPVPSPWQDLGPADLARPGHDPTTCPACRQASGAAWDQGVADAHQDAMRDHPTTQEALTP